MSLIPTLRDRLKMVNEKGVEKTADGQVIFYLELTQSSNKIYQRTKGIFII